METFSQEKEAEVAVSSQQDCNTIGDEEIYLVGKYRVEIVDDGDEAHDENAPAP